MKWFLLYQFIKLTRGFNNLCFTLIVTMKLKRSPGTLQILKILVTIVYKK